MRKFRDNTHTTYQHHPSWAVVGRNIQRYGVYHHRILVVPVDTKAGLGIIYNIRIL